MGNTAVVKPLQHSMGCSSSANQHTMEMTKSEKTMRAALMIQRWYRSYVARLEARRLCTWTIFQSIEYAGEQDQLQLYNFFNELLQTLHEEGEGKTNLQSLLQGRKRISSELEKEDSDLMKLTNPADIKVLGSYRGPHLKFPITSAQIETLIAAFKKKQVLHAKYLLELLHQIRKVLKRMSNITYVSTSVTKQLTICGDLHGKLDDLLIVFYKNGIPNPGNPYIFNGDFVDRGPNSVEVAILLFCCLLSNPNEVIINRGNHEDNIMNMRYGFVKEVMLKYKTHATKILRLFEDIFSWLPIAAIIDEKILVVHGGVSDKTDIYSLSKIDRHKYLSALRPPMDDCDDLDDLHTMEDAEVQEWRQILDVLWSDPKPQLGCSPNSFRGGGCYFGPDITQRILEKHDFSLLIRSHECKPEGYEYTHNDKVLTIFSASNYYTVGSNKGAYIKIGPDHKPHFIQYMASKAHMGRKLTITQRVSMIEASAVRSLKEKIHANRSHLIREFQKYDTDNTGYIKVSDWCQATEDVLRLDVPWRTLRQKIVTCDDEGLVNYKATFDAQIKHESFSYNGPSVTETLYRNRDSLETIFRLMDKDNSGIISMQEFEDACRILSRHVKSSFADNIAGMGQAIDINKDGQIDFNEFLEAFRLVEIEQQRRESARTEDSNSVQSETGVLLEKARNKLTNGGNSL